MMKASRIILSLLLLFSAAEVRGQLMESAGFEPDARTAGFGGAGVALDANALSLYRNTAALAFADADIRTQASYGLLRLGNGDVRNDLHTVGGYYRLNDKHSFAAGFRYFRMDEIENTVDGIEITDKVRPCDLMADIGYAHRLNASVGLSINVRYLYSKINDGQGLEDGSTVALDLGFHYRKRALSIAATVSNLGMLMDYGAKMGKHRMPANVRVGGAYRWEPAPQHRVTGSLEARYNFLPEDMRYLSGGAGLEYMFGGMFAVRGGYHVGSESRSAGNYGSVGCGVCLGPVTADFAFMLAEQSCVMHNVWQLTAGVRF